MNARELAAADKERRKKVCNCDSDNAHGVLCEQSSEMMH